jgi:steroid delta-isomerase-like uncharacterized protein
MPNHAPVSRRTLSKAAFGTFIGAATFRPGRPLVTMAQDASPVASPDVCPSTTPAENEAIVARYWDEVWNQGKDDTLKEVFTDTEVHHWGIGDDTIGPDEFLARIAGFRTAFPDFQIHIEQTISTGDLVVSRYRATATQQGDWLGIPATGTAVEYTGMNIFRIACGKIAESWGEADHLGLIEQLGGGTAVATPTA